MKKIYGFLIKTFFVKTEILITQNYEFEAEGKNFLSPEAAFQAAKNTAANWTSIGQRDSLSGRYNIDEEGDTLTWIPYPVIVIEGFLFEEEINKETE